MHKNKFLSFYFCAFFFYNLSFIFSFNLFQNKKKIIILYFIINRYFLKKPLIGIEKKFIGKANSYLNKLTMKVNESLNNIDGVTSSAKNELENSIKHFKIILNKPEFNNNFLKKIENDINYAKNFIIKNFIEFKNFIKKKDSCKCEKENTNKKNFRIYKCGFCLEKNF